MQVYIRSTRQLLRKKSCYSLPKSCCWLPPLGVLLCRSPVLEGQARNATAALRKAVNIQARSTDHQLCVAAEPSYRSKMENDKMKA